MVISLLSTDFCVGYVVMGDVYMGSEVENLEEIPALLEEVLVTKTPKKLTFAEQMVKNAANKEKLRLERLEDNKKVLKSYRIK